MDNNNNSNNTNNHEASDSLYSYNYRDKEQSAVTHEGDYYDGRHTADEQQSQSQGTGTYGQQSAEYEQPQSTDTTGTYAGGAADTASARAYADGAAEAASTGAYAGGGAEAASTGAYAGGAADTASTGAYAGGTADTAAGAQSTSTAGAQSTSTAGAQTDYSYQTDTAAGAAPKQKSRKKQRASGSRPAKKGGFGMTLIKGAAVAAVFGLVAGGVFTGVTRVGGSNSSANVATTTTTTSSKGTIDGTAVSTATTVTDVSDIVTNVMPSIVSITSMTQQQVQNFFGQSQTYDAESSGSGIIVAEDDDYLYIATNNHVVAGASSMTISFSDDTTVSATVKGTDESSDLAVVSVKKTDIASDTLKTIKIATLGDSSTLSVGESAVAIGNALGYGQSVTTGVISALNREVTTTDSSTGASTTNELIQTDAAINPGNSGGALLNIKGEIIGINSVKYSDTDVEGMGYAIPISTAQPIINDLINREKVSESQTAYLGISGVDVTSDVAETYNMPEGVYVAQVGTGTAAETAGLQKGDIITKFDGHAISTMSSLQEQLQYYSAGTKVEITIQQANNGEYTEKTISVTLGSKNAASSSSDSSSSDNSSSNGGSSSNGSGGLGQGQSSNDGSTQGSIFGY